jgi:hypothetical protein
VLAFERMCEVPEIGHCKDQETEDEGGKEALINEIADTNKQ